MPNSTGKVSIRCIQPGTEYRLHFKGSDWSETFTSVEAAVQCAQSLVVEETELRIYEENGPAFVLATLFPTSS